MLPKRLNYFKANLKAPGLGRFHLNPDPGTVTIQRRIRRIKKLPEAKHGGSKVSNVHGVVVQSRAVIDYGESCVAHSQTILGLAAIRNRDQIPITRS